MQAPVPSFTVPTPPAQDDATQASLAPPRPGRMMLLSLRKRLSAGSLLRGSLARRLYLLATAVLLLAAVATVTWQLSVRHCKDATRQAVRAYIRKFVPILPPPPPPIPSRGDLEQRWPLLGSLGAGGLSVGSRDPLGLP